MEALLSSHRLPSAFSRELAALPASENTKERPVNDLSSVLFVCTTDLQCFAVIGHHLRLNQTTTSSREHLVFESDAYRSSTMARFPPWILHDTDVKPPKTKLDPAQLSQRIM